jgi:hypothetical protein
MKTSFWCSHFSIFEYHLTRKKLDSNTERNQTYSKRRRSTTAHHTQSESTTHKPKTIATDQNKTHNNVTSSYETRFALT